MGQEMIGQGEQAGQNVKKTGLDLTRRDGQMGRDGTGLAGRMGQDGKGRTDETGRGGMNGNGTEWDGTERDETGQTG